MGKSYAERTYVPPYKRYVVSTVMNGKPVHFPEPKTRRQAAKLCKQLRSQGFSKRTTKMKKMQIPRWKNDLTPINLKKASKRYG